MSKLQKTGENYVKPAENDTNLNRDKVITAKIRPKPSKTNT